MKWIITILFILPVVLQAQPNNLKYYLTAAQMKRVIPPHNQPAILYGIDSVNDYKGGSMIFDSLYSGTIDNMNAFKPDSLKGTGAWVRRNTSQQSIGSGTLFRNGTSLFYTVSGTTDALGRITLILTNTGTTAGIPLFSKITSADISPQPGGLSGYWGYLYSVSADMKTIVVQFQSLSLGAIVAAVSGLSFNVTANGVKTN